MQDSFNYCERNSYDFFAEPLNAITNIFFILVAFLLFYQNRNKNKFLVVIIFLIGISSFLFHTIPSYFFGTADVFFILVFIIYYLYFLSRKVFDFSLVYCISFPLMFIVICYSFGNFFIYSVLATSAFYTPIVFTLYLIYFLIICKNTVRKKQYILYAAILFSASVTFRVLDKNLCNTIFFGTHFIWHILNAITLFYLGNFYYLNSTDPPQKNQPKPK